MFLHLRSKVGVKFGFESDRVVLTPSGVLVSKRYGSAGLFVLNVDKFNENVSSFAYIAESLESWHRRVGHSNMQTFKK